MNSGSGSVIISLRCRVRAPMGTPGPAYCPPDREQHHGDQDCNREFGRDHVVNARDPFQQIGEKTHDVVGDGGDRQAFDGLLKAQLQLARLFIDASRSRSWRWSSISIQERSSEMVRVRLSDSLAWRSFTEWQVRIAGAMRRWRKSCQVQYPGTATSDSAASRSSTISK